MRTLIASLLILLATMTSSGCLVIEKRTAVMIIPPESDEIHLYFVFEGISMWEDGRAAELGSFGRSQLSQAKADLNGLKKDGFSFLMPGSYSVEPLQHCRVDKLHFFLDPKRERRLCADRRITIVNRADFAKRLNESCDEFFNLAFLNRDDKEIQEEIKKLNDEFKLALEQPDTVGDNGMASLFKCAAGLMDIGEKLDRASIKRLKAAAKGGFRWVRFEPDTVRLVLPATPEFAKQIVANPKTPNRLKQLRAFITPIDLQTCHDGLAIVIGKKGEAIRMTLVDTRPHRACEEQALASYVGSPTAIMLNDGRPANADTLIQQFIAEKTKRR